MNSYVLVLLCFSSAIVSTLACDSTGATKCESTADCCDGYVCYEKNQYWAACKPKGTCDPTWVDPYDNLKWSCKPLGASGNGGNGGDAGVCSAKDGYEVVGDVVDVLQVGSLKECCDFCSGNPSCKAAALWDGVVCVAKSGTTTSPKIGVTAIVKPANSGSGSGSGSGANSGSGSGSGANSGSGSGSGSGSASGDLYCPSEKDMNLEGGTKVAFKNGGWEMTGDARVSSKTAWNLLGGYMEWDMDLSQVADGVNTNFYTSSPNIVNCGSKCYCDIQAGDHPSCMELDFIENNGKCAGATTLHQFATDGRPNNADCDRWGCGSTVKYTSTLVKFRANVGLDGTVNVLVNGSPNNKYSPFPSNSANQVVVSTMKSIGAVIESSQWFGWVPADNICPGGSAGGLANSVVKVMNVKVKGSVVQGPVPTRCS